MRIRHGVVVLLGAVLLFACGGPTAGDDCSVQEFVCEDESTALECREGVWSTLLCKGPGGCAVEDDLVRCDQSRNVEGDACDVDSENEAICGPGGTSLLVCRQGRFVKTLDCTSCTTGTKEVVCNP